MAGWLFVLTLAAVAFFLLRPSIVTPVPRSGNVVPVIVDASRSMAISDLAAATSTYCRPSSPR